METGLLFYVPGLILVSVFGDYYVTSFIERCLFILSRDDYKWVRRESRLLKALSKDYEDAQKSVNLINEKANQVWELELVGSARISLPLDETQIWWLIQARKEADAALTLVKEYDELLKRGFHWWRGLFLVNLVKTVQLWRDMKKARKSIGDHLKKEKVSVPQICETLELSMGSFRSLKDRPIDKPTLRSNSSRQVKSGVSVFPTLKYLRDQKQNMVGGMREQMRSVELKLRVLNAFVNDLLRLRLESEMEYAWATEAQLLIQEAQEATDIFYMKIQADQKKSYWLLKVIRSWRPWIWLLSVIRSWTAWTWLLSVARSWTALTWLLSVITSWTVWTWLLPVVKDWIAWIWLFLVINSRMGWSCLVSVIRNWIAWRKLKVIRHLDSLVFDLIKAQEERYTFNFIKREFSQVPQSDRRQTRLDGMVILQTLERFQSLLTVEQRQDYPDVVSAFHELGKTQILLDAQTPCPDKRRTAFFKQLRKLTHDAEFYTIAWIRLDQHSGGMPILPFLSPVRSKVKSAIIGIDEAARVLQKRIERHGIKRVKDLSTVVGLGEDIYDLLDKLVPKHNVAHQPTIVCIAGMKGIGKTTLAKEIINHTSIVEHFEIPHWFDLSHESQELSSAFTKSLEEAVKASKQNTPKKHLFVFDNISSVEVWSSLINPFQEEFKREFKNKFKEKFERDFKEKFERESRERFEEEFREEFENEFRKKIEEKFEKRFEEKFEEEFKKKFNEKFPAASEEESENEHEEESEERFRKEFEEKFKEEFENAFSNSNLNKMTIVATTRHRKVAFFVAPNSSHRLRLRTDEESWELFTQMVPMFGTIAESKQPEQVETRESQTVETPERQTRETSEGQENEEKKLKMAQNIVRRTGGLPFAILNLGYLFAGKSKTDEMLIRVLKHVTRGQNQIPWEGTWEDNKQDFKLETRLGKLLSIFEVIPSNFEISARRVVAIWVTRDWIESTEPDKTLEGVAYGYLWELIDRNIIQVVERKLNGNVNTCRFPAALREVWLQRPRESGNIRAWSLTTSREGQIAYHFDDNDANHNHRIHGLRTTNASFLHEERDPSSIMFFDTREGNQTGEVIGNFLNRSIKSGRFHGVLVLDLEGVFKPQLPKNIAELKQLRYLGLRWTKIDKIPPCVGKLLSLQYLDLTETSIRTLPISVWKLQNLRRLYLNDHCQMEFLPKSSGKKLQTLSGAFLDEDSCPFKDGLQKLAKLRKLGLSFQLKEGRQQELEESIRELTQLTSLTLKSVSKTSERHDLAFKDLSRLQKLSTLYLYGKLKEPSLPSTFPMSLRELILSASGLEEDPMQCLGNLGKLESLSLLANSYNGLKMGFSEGSFPELRDLKIWSLSNLESLSIDKKAMQSIREMEIRSCKRLEVSPGLIHLKTLLELKLTYMPKRYTGYVRNMFAPPTDDTSPTDQTGTSTTRQPDEKHHCPKIKVEESPPNDSSQSAE